ncbi:MAG: glycosyltransferase [PVC group bacterium]|nr:glycosyltransferase [PVC group bacterium]
MNILQILPQLKSGGVETGTVDLARELVNRQHKAVVISSGGALVEELTQLGARHYKLPVHKKSFLSVLSLIPAVARIIKKEKIDIIHARSRVPAWIGFFAAKLSKTIFITTCHGYYGEHFFSRVMGFGKYVIVISQIIGRRMIDIFGVANEKIRLIYRGVDLEKFKFRGFFTRDNPKEKVVGIIGRITPLKGHEHFIKALPQILSEFPGCKILIAGDAPKQKRAYYNSLLTLVDKLKIKDRVKFLGNIQDVPEVLKKLDVLVLSTTTNEAFGRVVIEAGAVGVPVIATRVGGVVEIIDHQEHGLLIDPADSYQLANAVVRMLKDKSLAEACAQRLQEKVRTCFSLERLADKTIAVYKEALEKRKLLVVKLGALGDVILISPALKALREKHPKASISLLIKKEYKDIIQACPFIDELIILKNKGIGEIVKNILKLKKEGFDVSIDFQNNRLSHLMCFLAGIPRRFGYKNNKFGWLLNCGIANKIKNIDPVAHQGYVLQSLGVEISDKKLSLWMNERNEEKAKGFLARQWLAQGQMLIGINAIASRRWQSKVWLSEYYAQLADKLANEFNARILFTGIDQNRDEIETIIAQTNCKPINACGKTSLIELAALVKYCAVFLTVDSAPMHIAAAVGTPFVALFGPTDPTRHLPYAEKFVLIKKNLDCAPCYKTKCFDKKCMKEISVDEVYSAMIESVDKKNEYITINNPS